MNCVNCGGQLRVLDYAHIDTNETYRRKKCLACGRLAYSIEFEVDGDKKFYADWYRSKTTQYRDTEKHREYMKQYNSTEAAKERNREYSRRYRAKKKAEKLAAAGV